MLFYIIFYILYIPCILSVRKKTADDGGFFIPRNFRGDNGRLLVGRVIYHYLIYIPGLVFTTLIAILPIVALLGGLYCLVTR